MSAKHLVRLSLRTSLTIFWNEVIDLPDQEGEAIIKDFTELYVRQDFKKGFLWRMGGTKREFQYYHIVEKQDKLKSDIKTIFNSKEIIKIDVIWGGCDELWAFSLNKANLRPYIKNVKPFSLGSVFEEDGDTLAKIYLPKSKIGYLFYAHDTTVYNFPKDFKA